MPKKICIDPGHGGYDPGAMANGLVEKDLNLAVALGLKTLIERAGISVIMTRTTDSSPADVSNLSGTQRQAKDLQTRCDISDKAGADLFLSIHFNAGGGVGAEAYAWPGGQAATFAPELVKALAPVMGVHGEPVKDGGPNGANLYVIKYTDAPAILIEVGYVDSSDAQKIRSNISGYAAMLAPALIKWLGGSVPVDAPAPPPAPSIPQAHVTVEDMHAAFEAFKAEMLQEIAALEEKLKG